MAESPSAEAQLYQHAHELLQAHARLLRDGRRQRPFHQALKKRIRGDSSVLDIGSGTGLWAIVAAQLGAKRVVAIEQDALLDGVIKALARANGVAERVEVVQGDSRQVQLGKDFDVVVTETIGYLGFDENIVATTMDARQRFLAPGGALIPETISLVVAGAQHRASSPRIPVGVPMDYAYFETLLLHSPAGLKQPLPLKLLTPPCVLIDADLTTLDKEPDLTLLTARWPAQPTDMLNGFVVWVEARLTKGVRLSTLRTTSWPPTWYPIQPFTQKTGDLEFQLALTAATNRWTATLTGAQQQETRAYSPALAATELLAGSRTSGSVFQHHQRLGIAPNP